MPQQHKTYLVVCEGPSETAYLQELNRFFRESQINILFVPKSSNGGKYSLVEKKYREIYKNNKKSQIMIWVDYDIYWRNDQENRESYAAKSSKIPDFLFSRMNFEDYLTLHLEDRELKKWIIQCESHKHFTNPMHSTVYEPLFKDSLFENYKKGDMPFSITQERLNRLFEKNNDPRVPISCDFATKLQLLLVI
jgi:hypothetical protein